MCPDRQGIRRVHSFAIYREDPNSVAFLQDYRQAQQGADCMGSVPLGWLYQSTSFSSTVPRTTG